MLYIRQIKNFLQKEFFEFIELNLDEQKKSSTEIENIKYSRSLVALSICMNSDISARDACKYITDGYDDYGLDGLFYNNSEKTLYLIQSKFHHEGHGSIELGDTNKFIKGVKDLVQAKYDKFNNKIISRKLEIENYLLDTQTRFVLIIVYSGQQDISQLIKKEMEEFLEENNTLSNIFSFMQIKLLDIYTYISRGASGSPINLDLVMYNWNNIPRPIKSYYGLVAGSDLASIFNSNGRKLFSPNIRVYLSDTEVNQGILDTVENFPDKFWYYNIGITALCDEIIKKPLGGTGSDMGIFECKNLRVVNGAQTVGSIAKAAGLFPENSSKIRVFIRIFEVDDNNNTDDSKKITRTNNTQNKIDSRDFVSLDPEQKRIHDELQVDSIVYLYKSGELLQTGQQGFDLNEATIARACVQDDVQLTVQGKREISKLWDDIDRQPYKTLFNGSTQGINIFKEVKILRQVEALITSKKASTSGKEKLFVTHGNRFLLHLVYQRLKLDNNLYTDPSDSIIEEKFKAVYQLLYDKTNELHSESVLGSLFKNSTKCKEIADSLINNNA
jgi:hypothetical protein